MPQRFLKPAVSMLLAVALGAAEGPRLEGSDLTLGRQLITIGASGLPDQVAIAADPGELPLAQRAVDEVDPAILSAVGRGPQLRAPIRIEVTAGGETVVAEPQQAATPTADGDTVTAQSTLAAGQARIKLAVTYHGDGRIDLVATPAAPAEVEALELVVEPVGGIDTVVDAAAFASLPVPAERFAIGRDPGVAWSSSERGLEGVPAQIYVGDGDRGFSLVTDGADWVLGDDRPVHSVVRDDAGRTAWRVALVGAPGKLPTAALAATLIAHPVSARPADHRRQAWLDWPHADASDALAAAAAPGETARLLAGKAGGTMASADHDLVATYPLAAYRYLSGVPSGQVARIVPDVATHVTAGAPPTADRAAIGRALLHDIGLDAGGLAHLAEARAVVEALHDFGYFAADGTTEFVPYWRTDRFLRYGQVFEQDGAFELTEEDPNADVHVSVYRRTASDDPKAKGRMKVLFVIVNEGDEDVEDILYLNDPKALFGGRNGATVASAWGKFDYSVLPPNADWKIAGQAPEPDRRRKARGSCLFDLVDGGTVARVPEKGTDRELYGPIHVPARGYRLVWGYGTK